MFGRLSFLRPPLPAALVCPGIQPARIAPSCRSYRSGRRQVGRLISCWARGVKREPSTMPHGNRNSKRKGRTKAVTVVAGALSLAGGAFGAAAGPPNDTLTVNTAVTLYEEEISDVSLSTFYVFDHENAGARRHLPRGHAVRRGKVAEAAQQTAEAEAPQPAQAPAGPELAHNPPAS